MVAYISVQASCELALLAECYCLAVLTFAGERGCRILSILGWDVAGRSSLAVSSALLPIWAHL